MQKSFAKNLNAKKIKDPSEKNNKNEELKKIGKSNIMKNKKENKSDSNLQFFFKNDRKYYERKVNTKIIIPRSIFSQICENFNY